MGPVEALKLALEREKNSVKMYEKFSSDFPVAKEIFIFLLNEEQRHKKIIEDKIVELTR